MYIVLEQNANMSYLQNFLTKIFVKFCGIFKNFKKAPSKILFVSNEAIRNQQVGRIQYLALIRSVRGFDRPCIPARGVAVVKIEFW